MPMTTLSLLFIDAEGKLYRGYGRAFPLAEWDPKTRKWRAGAFLPKPGNWGERVTPGEAERCYPGSSTAALPAGLQAEREFTIEERIRLQPELFDEYDGPISRDVPSEA